MLAGLVDINPWADYEDSHLLIQQFSKKNSSNCCKHTSKVMQFICEDPVLVLLILRVYAKISSRPADILKSSS